MIMQKSIKLKEGQKLSMAFVKRKRVKLWRILLVSIGYLYKFVRRKVTFLCEEHKFPSVKDKHCEKSIEILFFCAIISRR